MAFGYTNFVCIFATDSIAICSGRAKRAHVHCVETFLRAFPTEFDMHVFRNIQILGLRFLRQIRVAILRKANNIKMKLEKKRHPNFFTLLPCVSVFFQSLFNCRIGKRK